jgi:hypothetical protein
VTWLHADLVSWTPTRRWALAAIGHGPPSPPLTKFRAGLRWSARRNPAHLLDGAGLNRPAATRRPASDGDEAVLTGAYVHGWGGCGGPVRRRAMTLLSSVVRDLRSLGPVATARPHPSHRHAALGIALRNLRCAHSRPACRAHIACSDLIHRLHAAHGTHSSPRRNQHRRRARSTSLPAHSPDRGLRRWLTTGGSPPMSTTTTADERWGRRCRSSSGGRCTIPGGSASLRRHQGSEQPIPGSCPSAETDTFGS